MRSRQRSRSTAPGVRAGASPPPGSITTAAAAAARNPAAATASATRTRRLTAPAVAYLLIWNVSLPVDALPFMSVAIHRNVVVCVRWNVSPGSRGPVESHSFDAAVGLEPSIVYRITDGSLTNSNVVSMGPLDVVGPVI